MELQLGGVQGLEMQGGPSRATQGHRGASGELAVPAGGKGRQASRTCTIFSPSWLGSWMRAVESTRCANPAPCRPHRKQNHVPDAQISALNTTGVRAGILHHQSPEHSKHRRGLSGSPQILQTKQYLHLLLARAGIQLHPLATPEDTLHLIRRPPGTRKRVGGAA